MSGNIGTLTLSQIDSSEAAEDDYDLSNATRGKFYRDNAELSPPVHLDPEILSYLQVQSETRGTSLNQLVNDLLKKDIELIETTR